MNIHSSDVTAKASLNTSHISLRMNRLMLHDLCSRLPFVFVSHVALSDLRGTPKCINSIVPIVLPDIREGTGWFVI